MYEPIDQEFINESEAKPKTSHAVNSSEEREKFLDDLLTTHLNESKLREKDSIIEKLKYKKHQLEVASKQLKKENKKKRDAIALASGVSSTAINKTELSRKKKKALKICKLNKNEELNYEKYEQINKLWKSYANSSLMTCLTPNDQLYEENVLNCLKQLDYHGSYLTVTRSSSKHLLGLSGIVLQDRKNVFYFLTKENKIKIIPKANNHFELDVLNCKMTIVGSNMLHKPEMRATKHAKIKTRINIK
jgi:RNase P/RNase MRP subunit p29